MLNNGMDSSSENVRPKNIMEYNGIKRNNTRINWDTRGRNFCSRVYCRILYDICKDIVGYYVFKTQSQAFDFFFIIEQHLTMAMRNRNRSNRMAHSAHVWIECVETWSMLGHPRKF
jgi:hypothetical protein